MPQMEIEMLLKGAFDALDEGKTGSITFRSIAYGKMGPKLKERLSDEAMESLTEDPAGEVDEEMWGAFFSGVMEREFKTAPEFKKFLVDCMQGQSVHARAQSIDACSWRVPHLHCTVSQNPCVGRGTEAGFTSDDILASQQQQYAGIHTPLCACTKPVFNIRVHAQNAGSAWHAAACDDEQRWRRWRHAQSPSTERRWSTALRQD